MNSTDVITQAHKFGDFYMYYQQDTRPNNAFLVGTMDFSCPYISSKLNGLSNAFKAEMASPGVVTVWDWKSNRFKNIPTAKIKKLSPLASVLRN